MCFIQHRIEKLFVFQNAHATFEFLIVNDHQVVALHILQNRIPLLLSPVYDDCLETTKEFFNLSQPIVGKTGRAHDEVGLLPAGLFRLIEDKR
jgi:hypothetical protein